MLIDRIDLYHVAMPLIYPWKTAYGEDEAIHAVLCRLCSGSLVGWGESAPFAAPCYSPEWAGGIFAVARVPHHAQTDRVQGVEMSCDEGFKCRCITLLKAATLGEFYHGCMTGGRKMGELSPWVLQNRMVSDSLTESRGPCARSRGR